MRQTARAQATVLGVVLLIGLVSIVSVSVLLTSNEATDVLEHRSEQARIDGLFAELRRTLATAAVSTDATRAIVLESGNDGTMVIEDAGWIRIDGDGLDESITFSLGAIEYDDDDGTRVAYQGGGVWRTSGPDTWSVSSPPIHYDGTDGTFTFPVTAVRGERSLGSETVSIAHNDTDTFHHVLVGDDSVTITIQSEYYLGWKTALERQAGRQVVRNVDHEAQTVTVELGAVDGLNPVPDRRGTEPGSSLEGLSASPPENESERRAPTAPVASVSVVSHHVDVTVT